MNTIYYTDGYTNNKECGYLILSENIEIHNNYEHKKYTCNECEYLGMLETLKICNENSIIYSDSQLVVNQLTKNWKCNFDHLRILRDKCKEILSAKKVTIKWIPREKNKAGKRIEEIF